MEREKKMGGKNNKNPLTLLWFVAIILLCWVAYAYFTGRSHSSSAIEINIISSVLFFYGQSHFFFQRPFPEP